MKKEDLIKSLRFYFITDHQADIPMLEQVRKAVAGGATMVQYRNKDFKPEHIEEVYEISAFLKLNKIPFVVNDDILLARAVDADGVHMGQGDSSPSTARKILGKNKIIGISISSIEEFENTDFSFCDYLGVGPVFPTSTKPDAKKASGIDFLKELSSLTQLPMVAIGGINIYNTKEIMESGVNGISLISAISRAEDIKKSAENFSKALNLPPLALKEKWSDEFRLINTLKRFKSFNKNLRVKAGDDAALLNGLKKPVISTDTQRENVHFKLLWQSYYEIGHKAVSISLSDLAASYAEPESIFINLGLPSHVSEKDVEEMYRGIDENLSNFDCSIGGGNISSAEKLSIDIFVIGEGCEIFPKRSNGNKGDLICSTGDLGLARAGLEVLMDEVHGYDVLVNRFKYPKPRFDAAKILKEFHIDCVTDISDGVYGDIIHIAEESNLTAILNKENFIIHEELDSYCRDIGKNPEDYIVSGGEDYELLFTCKKDEFSKIKENIGSAFILGEFVEFTGNHIEGNIKGSSFVHGKSFS